MNTRVSLETDVNGDRSNELFTKLCGRGKDISIDPDSMTTTIDDVKRSVNKTNSESHSVNRKDKENEFCLLSNGKIVNLNNNASVHSLSSFTSFNQNKDKHCHQENSNLNNNKAVNANISLSSSSSLSVSIIKSESQSKSPSKDKPFNNSDYDFNYKNYFIHHNKKPKISKTALRPRNVNQPMTNHSNLSHSISSPKPTIQLPTKDFKDYQLTYNKDSINMPINDYLPKKQRNNDKYKLNLFRYYRKESISDIKSLNSKFASYHNSINHNKGTVKKNNKRSYATISEKKIYSSEHPFYHYKLFKGYNFMTKPEYFKFYYDNDIGFERKWQRQIHKAEMDDDVDTEDDIMKGSEKKVIEELRDAIDLFQKNRKVCRNYDYYHS